MCGAFDAAEKAFGTVTILINNAGIPHADGSMRYRKNLAPRAGHQSRCCALLGAGGGAAHDRGQEAGPIVNIASILGFAVSKGVAPIGRQGGGGAAHAGARARTFVPRRARDAIAPGFFATEINEDYLKDNPALTRSIPAGRIGEMPTSTARCCCLPRMRAASWPARRSLSTADRFWRSPGPSSALSSATGRRMSPFPRPAAPPCRTG